VEGMFLILNKKTKIPVFQVLLLDNGASEDVEVQEATQVNFFQVKEHLRNGGSVFIIAKTHKKYLIQKQKCSKITANQEEVMVSFSIST
jgi:hypothetical protein